MQLPLVQRDWQRMLEVVGRQFPVLLGCVAIGVSLAAKGFFTTSPPVLLVVGSDVPTFHFDVNTWPSSICWGDICHLATSARFLGALSSPSVAARLKSK